MVGALVLAGAGEDIMADTTPAGVIRDGVIRDGVIRDGDTQVGGIQDGAIRDTATTAVHMCHIMLVDEVVIILEATAALNLVDAARIAQRQMEEGEARMPLIIPEILHQEIAVQDEVL